MFFKTLKRKNYNQKLALVTSFILFLRAFNTDILGEMDPKVAKLINLLQIWT